MKKILTLIAAITMMCMAKGIAHTSANLEEINRLHKLGVKAYNEERYDESLKVWSQEMELWKNEATPNDSVLAAHTAQLGLAYHQLKQEDKALEMTNQALELHGSKVSREDDRYASYLDNLSVIYVAKQDYQKAYDCSQQAIAIYYKLLTNDLGMATALMHAAESCSYLGKHSEAAILQSHALNVYEVLAGKHSMTYLNELSYLIKYYTDANDEENKKAAEEKMEEIANEIKYGYVTPAVPLETPEDCNKYIVEAYNCCKYFLHHHLSAPRMQEASQMILRFADATDKVNLLFGEAEGKWVEDPKGKVFIFAYMAGYIMYALEQEGEPDPLENYRAAVTATVGYYSTQKELTGEVEALEQYLNLYKKSPKNLDKRIEKDFKAYQKEMKKGRATQSSLLNE